MGNYIGLVNIPVPGRPLPCGRARRRGRPLPFASPAVPGPGGLHDRVRQRVRAPDATPDGTTPGGALASWPQAGVAADVVELHAVRGEGGSAAPCRRDWCRTPTGGARTSPISPRPRPWPMTPGVPCRTIRWCRTAAGSLMAADRARAFSPVPVRSSCLEAGMPLVEVSLIEGRTPEQIRSLIHELHEAVVRALTAPPGNVRIIVREVPATHWAASDVTIAERHE